MSDLISLFSSHTLILLPILALIGFVFVIFASVAIYQKSRQRRKIADAGAKLIGKCPVCGGKIKPFNIFAGSRTSLRTLTIGAVRCTLCGHIEVFTPKEVFPSP